MKKYNINFSFDISEQQKESYITPETPISVSIKDRVPSGVNPIFYIASRITEELKRSGKNHNLDWEDEEKQETDEIVIDGAAF